MGFSAAALAEHLGGELNGVCTVAIVGPGEVGKPQPGRFVYAPNARVFRQAVAEGASLILSSKLYEPVPSAVILVANPRTAFHELLRLFDTPEIYAPGIAPGVVVPPSVSVDRSASIAVQVIIGERARIGARTVLKTGVVIGNDVVLGDDVLIGERVVLYRGTEIGNGVSIGAGTVVGGAGFGFEQLSDGGWAPIPQLGRVRIAERVSIGCNCTIDRATAGETVIGAGTCVDNLVHIAHNVQLGPDNLVLAQVGIAGSVTSGRGCIFGGQVGVADHCRIGDGVIIGSKAGVQRHGLRSHTQYWGNPARKMEESRRINAALASLPDLVKDWRLKKNREPESE